MILISNLKVNSTDTLIEEIRNMNKALSSISKQNDEGAERQLLAMSEVFQVQHAELMNMFKMQHEALMSLLLSFQEIVVEFEVARNATRTPLVNPSSTEKSTTTAEPALTEEYKPNPMPFKFFNRGRPIYSSGEVEQEIISIEE